MSANKTDISQIRKYLNGELDAKAMHRLEREAQDDPFLMDALEGYEVSGKDQQANLGDLQQRLSDRVAPKKERSIILWRVLPIAASLLVAISIGYLLFKPTAELQKATSITSTVILPAPKDKLLTKKDTLKSEISKTPLIAENRMPQTRLSPGRPHNQELRTDVPNGSVGIIKEDTTTYTASNYAVKLNTTTEELLKKLPGIEVDASGNITSQGKQITKARINGKDFSGNNVNQAVKDLPANVIQNIQIVDDYGDQSANTLARSNESNKILDIKTDTTKKNQLFAKNALAGRVPRTLNEVSIRGAASLAKKEVSMSAVTIKADTLLFKSVDAKAKKPEADSVSNLAEVVVPGYADKNDSPVQPANGWKSYLAYIKEQAVMPDNSIGKVRLAFKVGRDGIIYGIRILKGSTVMINQKAIDILKNGPVWIGSNSNKEIKVKIKFHKKT